MKPRFNPLAMTAAVLSALVVAAALRFPGFASTRVAVGLFTDQAVLGVMALGLTFVILTGGIDLSVGSMMALSGVASIVLFEQPGVPPWFALAGPALMGILYGYAQGRLVADLKLPPFLVTLGGLFVCRGLAKVLAEGSIQSKAPLLQSLSRWSFQIGETRVSIPALAFLAVTLVLVWTLRQTRFGRTSLAVGGDEQTALQMGLPVRKTVIGVYALSGICAALAGLVSAVYTGAGDPIGGMGSELDAISAVVIGGTLLRGGRGSVVGTVLGVATVGVIQIAIIFDGTLSSWWGKIAVAALLGAFLFAQSFFARNKP